MDARLNEPTHDLTPDRPDCQEKGFSLPTYSPADTFPSLPSGTSAAYVAYLNHELEMQKLLHIHPHLHTLLELRNTVPVCRCSDLNRPTLEEVTNVFYSNPAASEEEPTAK